MKKKVLFYILAVGMLCFGGCQNKRQVDEPAPMAELTATSTPMPTATNTPTPTPIPSMTTMELVRDIGVGINLGNTYEACGDWIAQWGDGTP